MTSLGALGALFFRGGLVKKVVTAYSGNSFPTYTPNPIFRQAYESGEVEVEHWSILTLAQRMEAAARGLPAMVTGSLAGSSMAANAAFADGRLALRPARAARAPGPRRGAGPRRGGRPRGQPRLLRAPARGGLGRLGGPPGRGGHGGAGGRRPRGAGAPGADPGPPGPGRGRGALRRPSRRLLRARPAGAQLRRGHRLLERGGRGRRQGRFDDYVDEWVLGPGDPRGLPGPGGTEHCCGWRGAPIRCRGRRTPTPRPVVDDPASRRWEQAAALGAREVERVVADVGADAVLAGAGVANLAAWVAVARARAAGQPGHPDGRARAVGLRADAGRPLHLQPPGLPRHPVPVRRLDRAGHGGRRARDARRWAASGRPRWTADGCLNSTELAGGRFLVGSGGANDVASRATACVVVTLARPERLPETVAYVTSPGHRVVSVVTDKGILRRHDGTLRVAAVPAGDGTVEERCARSRRRVATARRGAQVEELAGRAPRRGAALREFDRRGCS